MRDPRLRPLQAEDLPALHAIRSAAFAPIFQSFRDLVGPEIAGLAMTTLEREQADLLDSISAGTEWFVQVLQLGNEPVGFVSTRVDETTMVGEIGLNAVHPDHAGKGLGSWMYAASLDELKRRGAVVATVGTGGDPSHAAARRAYEKAGFGPSIPSIFAYKRL